MKNITKNSRTRSPERNLSGVVPQISSLLAQLPSLHQSDALLQSKLDGTRQISSVASEFRLDERINGIPLNLSSFNRIKLIENFPTTAGVSASCPLSDSAFNFLIDVIMEGDISLSSKDRFYNAAVRFILLYGSENWLRTSKDFHCLTIDVFRVLPESGGDTGAAMLNDISSFANKFRFAVENILIPKIGLIPSSWVAGTLRGASNNTLLIIITIAAVVNHINTLVKPAGVFLESRGSNPERG
ncbi:hypothetical protein T265_05652 [Opisthorchis viverrini]|uniref:Uncharacterized protein n=1 Tax=Opisthorchis viverrini TaxID=6198 RepID=A0A074ZIU7_OPIVI|nr:hypothetical protein T265_05652 [Opisthorchis viverrini]KER27248.1 hypothetical protein T265_05652 [Opisthorchis viverrini]